MLLGIVQHGIEIQALEVRDLNGLHCSGLDVLPLACCDVPQMPDSDGGIRWQVYATLESQVPVNFVLGPVLGIELGGCDDLRLVCCLIAFHWLLLNDLFF